MREQIKSTDPEIIGFVRHRRAADPAAGAGFPNVEDDAAYVTGAVNGRIGGPEANAVRLAFETWREQRARAAAAPATSQPAVNRPAPPAPSRSSAPAAPAASTTPAVAARPAAVVVSTRPPEAAIREFFSEMWESEGKAYLARHVRATRTDWEREWRVSITNGRIATSSRHADRLRTFEAWLAGREVKA